MLAGGLLLRRLLLLDHRLLFTTHHAAELITRLLLPSWTRVVAADAAAERGLELYPTRADITHDNIITGNITLSVASFPRHDDNSSIRARPFVLHNTASARINK